VISWGGHDAWPHARGPREQRELTCACCGYQWQVVGHTEYGTWWPERDDDLERPEQCGGEAQ
jgi:hypothetical protein